MPVGHRTLADILAPIQPHLEHVETALTAGVPARFALLRSLREGLSRQRGKRLRPSLVLLAGGACGPVGDGHYRVAALTELIHAASLIHDDIIDGAGMRRGQPSFPSRWGSGISVVFGDLLFSVSFGLTETFADRSIRQAIASATQDMCEGELLQHEFHAASRTPDPEEYLQMVRLKTASFLSACARTGTILSGGDAGRAEALARYGESLGIAFQIVDDCLDLLGSEGKMGKSLGTDISTGKRTLPLILLLAGSDSPEQRKLKAFLSNGDEEPRREAILPLLEAHGCVEAAYRIASEHAARAQESLADLPASPFKESLSELAEYVLTREQ